jgi:hypothetical protein
VYVTHQKVNISCRVILTKSTGSVDVTFDWKNNQFSGLEPLHQDHIVQVLITQLLEEYALPDNNTEGGLILETPFFTEYERNGFVYCGHPNYRGLGAYYDWAKICWEDGYDAISGKPQYKNYIGRIHGFILHPIGNYYAIIHSTKSNMEYWHLEFEGTDANHRPILQLVDVDCLMEHVCMIPYNDHDTFM